MDQPLTGPTIRPAPTIVCAPPRVGAEDLAAALQGLLADIDRCMAAEHISGEPQALDLAALDFARAALNGWRLAAAAAQVAGDGLERAA